MRSLHLVLSTLLAAAVMPGQAQALSSPELRFEHVMTIGSPGVEEGQFKYVEDFAFAKDGHLLVTDAAHGWVQAFDRRSGKFVARFGGRGEADRNLEKPEGIAVDPDGNIFVGDYNTGYVQKYSPSFEWLLTFSEYGSGPGQMLKAEFMDIRNGRLVVPDAGNHRISVFDLAGGFLFDFGGPGSEPGRLNTPEAAKFGPDGRLYVTDLRNDRIQVFDADGKFLKTWGRTGRGNGELKSPSGLAIGRDGTVYVAEIGNDRIQAFDKDGRCLAVFGSGGSAEGQFSNLHGLIVDDEAGLLYVADTGNNRVQVFRIARVPGQ